MLGFDGFDDFFVRLMYCFMTDKEKFGCGACCRSLIPKIVREGQKLTEGDMTFNDMISLFWIVFSEEEKKALKEQYFHYFYEIKKGPRTKMYEDFCKQIEEKTNIV